VERVVLACLRDILLQSVSHVAVETFDVEVHVVLMELLEHFCFCKDICIDTKECWNFFFFDVHEVLVRQVAQKNVAAVSSVLRQAVENALLLLDVSLTVLLAVLVICIFLVFHELIEAILFIVLVVIRMLLSIAVFKDKKERVSCMLMENKGAVGLDRLMRFKHLLIGKFGLNLLFCAVALVFILINLVNVVCKVNLLESLNLVLIL